MSSVEEPILSDYTNITCTLERPLEDYVAANWVHHRGVSFFKKEVCARGGYLALALLSKITACLDVLVGVGAGLVSVSTRGMHKTALKIAVSHLNSSRLIVARPYMNLLKAFNPEAKFSDYVDRRTAHKAGEDDLFITDAQDGFIAHYVNQVLKNIARSYSASNNFFEQQVVSRATYVLLAYSSVTARVIDTIIAGNLVFLSFIMLGKIESINNLAYRTLQGPGVINDLFYCVVKFINPWAGVSHN